MDWTIAYSSHAALPPGPSMLDDRDGGTMFEFTDPDGNAWVVQQMKVRAGKPLLRH
jgi:hypothetical protein